MSGRKKNRKHRHGQPPNELLNELNSLRELLGSDMEADIPLLDQVAGPTKDEPVKSSGAEPAPQPPVAPQRPLQEADLPILFSPVDEEPAEEYTPLLSDADRELLRPLQNLPRHSTPLVENQPDSSVDGEISDNNTGGTTQERPAKEKAGEKISRDNDAPHKSADTDTGREEFQPGLFDAPQKPHKEPAETALGQQAEPEPSAPAPNADKKPQTTRPPLPAALSENPFLPPHIRARLTGGKIPRPEPEPKSQPAPEAAPTKTVDPEVTPKAELQAEQPENSPEQESPPSERERLIEQLMAEQLPELERQLRANIVRMVDEIYPEEAEID